MNLTNIKYLYDLIDKDSFVYFTIYDSKGSIMRDQCNEAYSVSDAKEDLEQFLGNNSGIFRVEFRKTKGNSPTTKNYSFTIDNQMKEQREDVGMGSPFMGSDQSSIIAAKDEKIDNLRNQILADSMANMNRIHELQIESVKREFKNSDGNNDALIQAAMSAITGMFGGQSIGVSGLGSVEAPTEILTKTNETKMTDTNKIINSSVVRLISNDPNFAEHIQALANLSESNPLVYNMAIAKLKDF